MTLALSRSKSSVFRAESRLPQVRETPKALPSEGPHGLCCDLRESHLPLGGNHFRENQHIAPAVVLRYVLDGSTRCGISAKRFSGRRESPTNGVAHVPPDSKLMAEDYGSRPGTRSRNDGMYHGGRQGRIGRLLAWIAATDYRHGIVERKGRIMAQVSPELTIAATSALVKEYVLLRA